MNRTSHLNAAICALTIAVGTLPVRADAQTTPPSFTVTSIAQSAQGKSVIQEQLSFSQSAGGGLRLQLASADGSLLSAPVTLNSQGEIASNSQDAAVTCYNMARDVLASQDQPASDRRALVFVRFGRSVVTIPLALNADQSQGSARRMTFDGASSGIFTDGATAIKAGVVMSAVIDESAGSLRGASFDEVHYLGSPEHIIARSTCILSPVERPATTRV